MENGSLELALLARKSLEDKKGEDIRIFDVRGISAVTDYYIVVSGSSPPHLKAMFNEVQAVLKHSGSGNCYRRSGSPESGWLALDYVDVIIHIFSHAARKYYAIEELWAEAAQPESSDPSPPDPP